MNRLTASLRLEVRLQVRYGLLPVAAVLTASTTGLAWMLGPSAVPILVPLLLVLDTAAFGVFFVAVLILTERAEGGFDVLAISPLRAREYLATKVGLLTLVSAVAAVPITLAALLGNGAGPGGLLLTVLGVTLLAALLLTWTTAFALPCRTLMDFIGRGIWPILPLLLAPVPHLIGWAPGWWYAIPSTGAADLVRAGLDPDAELPAGWRLVGIVGYLAAALAAAAWLAARRWHALETSSHGAGSGASRASGELRAAGARPLGRSNRSRSFRTTTTLAWLDLRTITRDPMLGTILLAPVLIALLLRFGYPAFEAYALQTWALALEPHRPLLAVALVVLHVPYMVGSFTALLIADDLDERHLWVLRSGPMSVAGYLAYRLGTAGLLSMLMLALAISLVGVDLLTWSLPLALVLLPAAATGPLTALLIVTFASNRVQALSALKVVNLVPIAVPVAAWLLPDPARWLLAPLPYFWISEAAWSVPGVGGHAAALSVAPITAAGYLIVALATVLACCGLLGHRAATRLGTA